MDKNALRSKVGTPTVRETPSGGPEISILSFELAGEDMTLAFTLNSDVVESVELYSGGTGTASEGWSDEVLELRRWFAVKPAETVVTWVGDGRTGVGIAEALQRKLGDRYAVQAVGGPEVTLRKPDWMPWWSENLYAEMKTTIPDIVVIALGSNDSRPQFWDPERLEADAAELVNELRQNDSHPVVLLALPPPVFDAGGQGFDAEVLQRKVLPIIRGVAEETDAELVDFNAPFQNRRELFPDGVHLGAEGQEMLLELAAKRIREVQR